MVCLSLYCVFVTIISIKFKTNLSDVFSLYCIVVVVITVTL